MRIRRRFTQVAMPRYLVGVLLAFVSIGTAGCDTSTYTYGGTTYNSSADALEAERRDNEAVLAAITKRDRPIASKVLILMPSEDRLFENVHVLRCGLFWEGCRTQSSIDEEKTHNARWQHETLLNTARSIERSNLFGKVEVEEYSSIDQAKINASGDLAIVFHLGDEKKFGWYLHTRRDPAGTYLPFDDSIRTYSGRVAAWLNALEAFVRPNIQS